MHVEPNTKFAAFFLSRCGVKPDLPQEEEQIEKDIWVSQKFDLAVAAHWQTWLGSLATDEMREGGLLIYVTGQPSKQPEVLDGENQALQQEVNDILNGLLLQGVPGFMRGFIVNGANVNGQIGIRQHASIRELDLTHGQPEFLVGIDEARRSVSLARRLRYIQDAPRPEWGRVIRAVRTLLLANHQTNSFGERLHQFVRALEGLIKVPKGNGRKTFAHRAQTFAVAGDAPREALLELYDLRSAVEHLGVPIEALAAEGTEKQRLGVVDRRTRQADALARLAILRALESPVIFNYFRTDAQIDEFWKLADDVKVLLWGDRLDIMKVP